MAITSQNTKGTNLGQVGGTHPGVPDRETARVSSGEEQSRDRSQGKP